MSVRCGESPWLKSVVNGLPGVEVPVAGKVREMEARVFFNPANLLIPFGLAETPGMPGDAPDGPSSEDLEGVKYIHLLRVMGRTGDTRRWPRLPRRWPRLPVDGPVFPSSRKNAAMRGIPREKLDASGRAGLPKDAGNASQSIFRTG